MIPRAWPDVRSLAPGVAAMRGYRRSALRGDLVAGVTVAAYLVPQVMAYAEVAGMPAVAGLWAAIAALLVYAVLGSSPQLSVGPESTTALMTAVALGTLGLTGAGEYAATAAMLAVLVGSICILGWALSLGFVAEALSRPVLDGYLCGIAVLMVVSQLDNLTRLDIPEGSVLEQGGFVMGHVPDVHVPTAVMAVLLLCLLFLGSWKVPRLPVPLVAVVLAAGAVVVLGLESRGVAVVGSFNSALPSVELPRPGLDDVALLLPAALSVALVGFTDNVLTARAFATRRGDTIDNNQELLALGVANLAAGATQGFPVSSSGSRTAIGVAAGSQTQLHSVIALLAVVLAAALAGPALAVVPAAALGALVVYAASRLVDVADLRRLARFRRTELWLCLATATAVVLLGPLTGVLVAVGLSVLDLLHRVARPHDGVLAFVPGVAGMHDVDDYPTAQPVTGLVVYRYDSPLFFANAQDFLRRALRAVDTSATPVEWFLLNAEANVSVDVTALDALVDLDRELKRRGVILALARVKHELRDDLVRGGFVALIGPERVFMTLPTAVQAYAAWYRQGHGDLPQGLRDGA